MSVLCPMLSRFSCVQLCAALWAVALQAPRSMGFSRQEYWSGLPCPPPGDLPNVFILATRNAGLNSLKDLSMLFDSSWQNLFPQKCPNLFLFPFLWPLA